MNGNDNESINILSPEFSFIYLNASPDTIASNAILQSRLHFDFLDDSSLIRCVEKLSFILKEPQNIKAYQTTYGATFNPDGELMWPEEIELIKFLYKENRAPFKKAGAKLHDLLYLLTLKAAKEHKFTTAVKAATAAEYEKNESATKQKGGLKSGKTRREEKKDQYKKICMNARYEIEIGKSNLETRKALAEHYGLSLKRINQILQAHCPDWASK